MTSSFLRCVCVMCLLLATSDATAEEPSPMRESLHAWFDGERNEGYVFVGAGAASVGAGAFLVTTDDAFARGAGISMIGAGGLMFLGVGAYLVGLGPERRERAALLTEDRTAFLPDERRRIEGITKRFVIYRWVEIAMIAVGGGLAAWGYADDRPLVAGVGVGLAGEFALALVLDLFAERRAHRYLDVLKAADP